MMIAFLVGAVLPDIMSYSPLFISSLVGLQPPEHFLSRVPFFFFPFHGLIGFSLLCWLLALLCPAAFRKEIFINLELGGLIHIGLDLLQVQHAQAGYLLFPFSWRTFNLNLMETESSLKVLPIFLAAAVLVVSIDFLMKKRQKGKVSGLDD